MPRSSVRYTLRARQTIGGARVVVRRDTSAKASPAAPPAEAPHAPRYERMNKAELVARAASLGLDTAGTNAALIARIKRGHE